MIRELGAAVPGPPGGEAGYTLPELLVALAIGLLVAFGATSLVMMAVRAEPRTSEKVGQLQQGRAMTERLVRELRQGEEVFNPTESGLEVLTRVHGGGCEGGGSGTVLCRVAYQCAVDSCTRVVLNPDGSDGAPAEELVTGLLSAKVFGYEAPAEGQPPDYVSVELAFASETGGESVTVADGTALRNWSATPELGEE